MSTLMELLNMVRGGPRVGLGTRGPAPVMPPTSAPVPQGVGAENWASYTPEELRAIEDFEIKWGIRPQRPRPYGQGHVVPVAPQTTYGMSLRDLMAQSSKPSGPMPPPRIGPYGMIPVATTQEEIDEFRRRTLQSNL